MNYPVTFRILGGLLICLGLVLLLPFLASSLWFRDGQWWVFLVSAGITAGVGTLLFRKTQTKAEITYREGFAIVTFGWIFFALFGALPYILSSTIGSPIDAFFEAMSGFSTTGATVIENLDDADKVPRSILLWRAMTQWLGGMGIIVLGLAILPFLGIGGMQLFEAEVPGPTADRLAPRIQDTAKLLWGVYVGITVAELLLLWLGPMNFFEATCHALTTMATGGFSTKDASIAGYTSSYTHLVITFFMFLAGVNFSLHFHALRGKPGSFWKSEEFLTYLGIVGTATITLTMLNHGLYESWLINLRDAAFQTVALLTTTGFVTADYEQWPVVSQYLLVMLMFLGGCAGSTGGGIKIVRILLVFKHAYLQIFRLIHPREVRILRLDHKPVSPEVIQSILGFVALFLGLFLLASLLMALVLGGDTGRPADVAETLETAGASVIASLGNIGPGIGGVGPTDNYADIPAVGKLLLCLCMLIGRLEIFTVLVLFFPSFWRK